MESRVRRYGLVIRVKNQGLMLRDIVDWARFLKVEGYVFLDLDGSLRAVIQGADYAVDHLLGIVSNRADFLGGCVSELRRRDVSTERDLPPAFVKIPAELGWEAEAGRRKLDKHLFECCECGKFLGEEPPVSSWPLGTYCSMDCYKKSESQFLDVLRTFAYR